MADAEQPKMWKRSLFRLGQSALTLSFAGLASTAVVLGVGFLTERAAAVPPPDAAAPVPVQVQTIVLENGYNLPRRFVGQVEPRAQVSLSFELSGRLEELTVEEGEEVLIGQELARLDTDLLHAEAARLKASRSALAAQLNFAETRLKRSNHLQKQGFTSQDTLDEAIAMRDELTNRIAETEAAMQAVSINLNKSVLYAPFSGKVAIQSAEVAETVQAGQQIISVLETAQPEMRVGLPLDVMPDDLLAVEIDLQGQTLPAVLKNLRPGIDPITRTRTALFEFKTDADVIFGQTATLTLNTKIEARGVWVPLDALQSSKGSVWTVMTVQENQIFRAAVELLHVDGAHAFVSGTLQGGDLIVVSGAHRIVAGQTVHAIADEG